MPDTLWQALQDATNHPRVGAIYRSGKGDRWRLVVSVAAKEVAVYNFYANTRTVRLTGKMADVTDGRLRPEVVPVDALVDWCGAEGRIVIEDRSNRIASVKRAIGVGWHGAGITEEARRALEGAGFWRV